MSSANYRRGADLERAAKHYLEDNGYYVIKSAGSKGIADLVGIKPGEILYVQCKLDGYLGSGPLGQGRPRGPHARLPRADFDGSGG